MYRCLVCVISIDYAAHDSDNNGRYRHRQNPKDDLNLNP